MHATLLDGPGQRQGQSPQWSEGCLRPACLLGSAHRSVVVRLPSIGGTAHFRARTPGQQPDRYIRNVLRPIRDANLQSQLLGSAIG